MRHRHVAAIAVLLVAVAAFLHQRHPNTTVEAPAAAAAGGEYTLLQEPQAGLSQVYQLLDSARTSISMTMYQLDDAHAETSLISAASRGVQVRVILDKAYHGQSVNQPAFNLLHNKGIHVVWGPAGYIVHQKTITIDHTLAIVSTGNLTPNYYSTSRDAWIIDHDATQAAAIEATFDRDFDSGDAAPSDGTAAPGLVWSPHADSTYVDVITHATHSVAFTSEVLSDPAIINALAADANRGVTCQIVMTTSPDWTPAFTKLRSAGCTIHAYPATTHVTYMHEKIILTDAGTPTGELLIGSQNASTGSLSRNRELSLLLTTQSAAGLLTAVSTQFNADYATAPNWSH